MKNKETEIDQSDLRVCGFTPKEIEMKIRENGRYQLDDTFYLFMDDKNRFYRGEMWGDISGPYKTVKGALYPAYRVHGGKFIVND